MDNVSTISTEFTRCVVCETPIKLICINTGSTVLTAWYECRSETASEVTFSMHTIERCREVSGANLVPCVECGTPVELRLPQPDDLDEYGGPVYDEGWIKRGDSVATRDWHSPKRCAAARTRKIPW
jgi:hypothetical protein